MPQPFIVSGSLSLPVGWRAAPHRHPHAELILVADGTMTADIAGREQAAGPGELLFYPPGILHWERNTGRRSLELRYVHGRLDTVPDARLSDRSGRLGQLVRWLVEDQTAGAPAETLAAWLAVIQTQVNNCSGVEFGLARSVRSGMRAQLASRHTVAGLARSAGLGPRQFLRNYRAETGSTPMADLRRMRCEAAADLLVSTDWPLDRIATAVGFCDAFHLSKVFRSRYGTPPGRMRSHAGRPGTHRIQPVARRRRRA